MERSNARGGLYDDLSLDALIERLRARAADPERRVDARETHFFAAVKGLELGGLLGMLGDVRLADGGFGPGSVLIPIDRVATEYGRLRELMGGTGHAWPDGLLPVVDQGQGWDCIDAAGRVVAFDWEEVDEDIGAEEFAGAFRELAPTVEAWLEEWVSSPGPAEREAAIWADAAAGAERDLREARAAIARMTPEERTAMGFSEVGWESLIGLDEDGPSSDTGPERP